MAGRGPAPKPAGRRSRTNHNMPQFRVIEADPVAQPDLPSVQIEEDGELVEFVWPAVTQEFWSVWRESPLSEEFTAADWSFLLDTALIHARFWRGDLRLGAELRLRVAKFGATPEDRLRLRIQFETADEAESRGQERRARRAVAPPKDDPRDGLRVV